MDDPFQMYVEGAAAQAAAEFAQYEADAAKKAEAQAAAELADAEKKAYTLRQHATMLVYISKLANVTLPVERDLENLYLYEELCKFIHSIWRVWELAILPVTSINPKHPRDSTIDEVVKVSLYLAGKLVERKKDDNAGYGELVKELERLNEKEEELLKTLLQQGDKLKAYREMVREQEMITRNLSDENTQFRARIIQLEKELANRREVNVADAGRRHGNGLHASGHSNKTLHF